MFYDEGGSAQWRSESDVNISVGGSGVSMLRGHCSNTPNSNVRVIS